MGDNGMLTVIRILYIVLPTMTLILWIVIWIMLLMKFLV